MVKNSKYYTPEIEEFYVGFEYQEQDGENWTDEICGVTETGDLEFYKDVINEGIVRVKYLDKEDIESFGFTQITKDCFNLPLKEYRGRLNEEVRILFRKTTLIYLAMHIEDKDNLVLFTGSIKNKSELKGFLNQLKVVTKT